jgi:hypothetical protein
VSDVAAKLAHLIAWKGKVFDPRRGEPRNEIGPSGAQAIRAKVYYAESWFDQKEAIKSSRLLDHTTRRSRFCRVLG